MMKKDLCNVRWNLVRLLKFLLFKYPRKHRMVHIGSVINQDLNTIDDGYTCLDCGKTIYTDEYFVINCAPKEAICLKSEKKFLFRELFSWSVDCLHSKNRKDRLIIMGIDKQEGHLITSSVRKIIENGKEVEIVFDENGRVRCEVELDE